MWGFNQDSCRKSAVPSAAVVVLLLAFALSIGPAAADAPGDTRWQKLAVPVFRLIAHSGSPLLSTDQGLPHTELPTSVTQDGDGFLWIGTQNGLERWDGYRFRVFTASARELGALPDSFIQVLHTDALGRLWIGTNAGGLARYVPEHDEFVVIPIGDEGTSGKWITSIEDDGAGGLWVGTADGLDHLDGDGRPRSHLRHVEDDPGSLPDDYVRALLHDRDGELWVATAKGLVRCRAHVDRFVPVDLPSKNDPVAMVRTLFQSSDGRVWIGTRRSGVYVVAPGSSVAEPLRPEGLADANSAEILSAAETQAGEIWLGTDGEGILAIEPHSLRAHVIAHSLANPVGLPDDTAWALYRDRAGSIWVGGGRGISHVEPQRSVMTVLGLDATDGMTSSDIVTMLAGKDGRLMLAAGQDGVDLIDPEQSFVGAIRPDATAPETSLPKDNVTALSATEDGDWFIGTRRGLYFADRTLRRVARVPIGNRDAGAQIWTLRYDQKQLWVGGPDGVWALARRPELAPVAQWMVVDQLDLRRASVFAPAPRGAIWIGTMEGLFRYEPAVRKLEPVPLAANSAKGPEAHFVTSLQTDRRGRLWIGANGEGIFVLDLAKPGACGSASLKRIEAGLPNSTIDTLLQDDAGLIWASTDNGIARIDPDSFAIRTIGAGDELTISNYFLGSGLKTTHGELIFGGQGGLSIIRPDWLRGPERRAAHGGHRRVGRQQVRPVGEVQRSW